MSILRSFLALVAFLIAIPPSALALDDLLITEFMAENENTLRDDEGNRSDWIEIFNAGTNTVNLEGWCLTDTTSNPNNWWRFPATNIAPGSFLIVYASGEDRRIAGEPLHTNFRIRDEGEYLALVKPDRVTVQSSYTPIAQAPDISYGIPVVLATTSLVGLGAPARLTVPLSDTMGLTWTLPGFADGSWAAVTNGVGFEAEPAPSGTPNQIADSIVDFSGTQGANSWFYGYWHREADANNTYEAADFVQFPRGTGNVLADTNYWNGTKWDWPAGDPPWTELTAGGGHPNASNGIGGRPTHWAIRRYVSESDGPLRITGTLACYSSGGTCGDGVIGRIFVNGTQVYEQNVSFQSLGYSIVVAANVGSQIDFVIESGSGNNDFCDTTTFTAKVYTSGGANVVANSMNDWSFSGGQGNANWFYGYFNRGTGGVYTAQKFVPFPFGTGPHSAANYWNGEAWKWFDGDPPFDTIGQVETRPSIFPTGASNEHWVIRRWISEVSGSIHIDWHIGKKDLTGAGVTGAVYQNGTSRDTFNIPAADFVGTNRSITLTGVQVGDIIDFAVSPGTDIIGDISFHNAVIHGSGNLAGQFVSNVGNLMTNINSSAYLRIPFSVTNVESIIGLTLRMKSDDGFVAYLNGSLVQSFNAPDPVLWNSAATASRPDTDASQFDNWNLDGLKDLLVNGPNVLAIQALNASSTDQDLLVAAELIATSASLNPAERRYFASPTPGSVNGVGTTNIGPLITTVQHQPAEPLDTEDLVVSARITPTRNPLNASSVNLYYRVMYGAEAALPMVDNGLNGDITAGDGIYTAIVPNSAYTNGQMVRYYFTAADSLGNASRSPALGDTNNASLYHGTVVQDPTLVNPLPVLQWFIPPNAGTALDNGSAFARCSLYWKGEFYDNLRFTRHGQSSTGFRKKSYNVDFNPDHSFLYAEGEDRVDDINLLNTYPDKSHMRNMLSYGIHGDAGPRSPTHFVVPVRLQSNAIFYGTAHIVENGDDNYVKRIGRDKNGALYKMYDTMSASATAEKKTRRFEGRADLDELISRSATSNPTNRNWIYDNVDVSETINFLAAMVVTANIDCCHKNYYVYRDSEGDGEWEMLPWDVDLSFGRNWQSAETYWDDRVYPTNNLFVGGNATLVASLFANNTTTRAMYLRRVRTLQEQLLQTNGTPAALLNFEKQIDAWADLITPDALMDFEKWGTWGGGAQSLFPGAPTYSQFARNLPQSVAELKTNYLPRHRAFVFNQRMVNPTQTTPLPDAQPTNPVVLIGAVEYNPASRNQAEEYFQLINTNNFAVDISGWMLTGAVRMTFQGGVVIPPAGSSNVLYVAADKKAFRNRSVSPRGGQGHYVEGPYDGQLSARGETLVLIDDRGRVVTTNSYAGNPSGPQQYLRVTEIMYHPPAPPTGSPYDNEQFEYIELRNTGPTNLNLTGVRFTTGINFDFTGSAVTNLAPGAYVLLVRNTNAFASRYGTGFNIAGQYTGILNNGGERIRLFDAIGENIHDFDYENDWYPVTDGPGASLVIVNANGDWRLWDVKEGWRPSANDFGSPAATDPATPPPAIPVIINELLTHTDLPQVDAIEIFNPTATEANIGGWFLTDDFASPKKYRIPDDTKVPAGGYKVFYESNSFGVGPNAFAISSTGDETYIFSGNGTNITGYLHGYEFAAAANGVSFGRYTNSQTNVHFVAQNTLTLGQANGTPKVGPVVISEIHYHPVELRPGVNNELDEYIEIANVTGAPVPLFDPAAPANRWRLRGGADFDFPANITLPANGHLILVSFNPGYQSLLAGFRARYSVPENVVILGPFDGQLDNAGESLRLSRPDSPDGQEVPYILVDEVEYGSKAPWPGAADGTGPSLQRIAETAYGNDPVNWTAVGPSAGSAFQAGGTPPTITVPPVNTFGVVGRTATLTVSVSGTAPFFYQWRFRGANLPGANTASLTRSPLQLNHAGEYDVVVFNSAGSIVSPTVTLTVVSPPFFTLQPVGRSVYIKPDSLAANLPDGTNVTFTVGASSGNSGITYQWRFNGEVIPGQTNSSLTVTNVQIEDDGDYVCQITDSIDSVLSSPARLIPFVRPMIQTVNPVGSTNIVGVPLYTNLIPAGSTIDFSATVFGHPRPFGYFWRIGSSNFVPPIESAAFNNTAQFTTGPNPSSGTFRIIVTNAAQTNLSAGLWTATFLITTLADFDKDGIPDNYEVSIPGLSTNNAADGATDLDGDGMNNRDEYVAGTDPANAASKLEVKENVATGSVQINVAVVSNRTYSVQYTDNMSTGPWNNLGDINARTTNRVETFVDPQWTTNRFYRVVLPNQP